METGRTSSGKRHPTIVFLGASMAFSKQCFTSKFFSNLLYRLGVIVTLCLAKLGLRRRRPDQENEAESSSSGLSDDTVLIMDGSCPMLVPVHVVTSMIKSRIPVVEFGEYLERRRRNGEEGCERCTCCAVCLGTIEWGHVIREPSNCDHVFHRECLDRWIGEHRVTCPLCRCMMLPSRRNITFC